MFICRRQRNPGQGRKLKTLGGDSWNWRATKIIPSLSMNLQSYSSFINGDTISRNDKYVFGILLLGSGSWLWFSKYPSLGSGGLCFRLKSNPAEWTLCIVWSCGCCATVILRDSWYWPEHVEKAPLVPVIFAFDPKTFVELLIIHNFM